MDALTLQPRIETERLVLRRPRFDDAWRIADLINDYDVVRMLSRVPYPYSLDDAETFLRHAANADPERDLPLVIEHKAFGLIGLSGFHLAPGERIPEIGYWLGRTFWQRGFATEATSAALAWARERWGKRAIVSGHFAENAASGRVLEKAGFLYTGEVLARHCVARGEVVPTRMMVWLA